VVPQLYYLQEKEMKGAQREKKAVQTTPGGLGPNINSASSLASERPKLVPTGARSKVVLPCVPRTPLAHPLVSINDFLLIQTAIGGGENSQFVHFIVCVYGEQPFG
jgi:hypothetical protein